MTAPAPPGRYDVQLAARVIGECAGLLRDLSSSERVHVLVSLTGILMLDLPPEDHAQFWRYFKCASEDAYGRAQERMFEIARQLAEAAPAGHA